MRRRRLTNLGNSALCWLVKTQNVIVIACLYDNFLIKVFLYKTGVQEAFLRLSLALISLSKSASNCGLVTKDYDSRRKSVDLVSFPPNLKLLREQIKREEMPEEDEEEEEDDNTAGRCC